MLHICDKVLYWDPITLKEGLQMFSPRMESQRSPVRPIQISPFAQAAKEGPTSTVLGTVHVLGHSQVNDVSRMRPVALGKQCRLQHRRWRSIKVARGPQR